MLFTSNVDKISNDEADLEVLKMSFIFKNNICLSLLCNELQYKEMLFWHIKAFQLFDIEKIIIHVLQTHKWNIISVL
jgi:hypothetical protein